VRSKIADTRLQLGDVLLVQGNQKQLAVLQAENDFDVLGVVAAQRFNRKQAWTVAGIFVGALLLGSLKLVPLPAAMLLGAVLVFVTGCITPDDAYRQVDWKVLILIGSMLGLGVAMQATGTAEYLAGRLTEEAGTAYEAHLFGYERCWSRLQTALAVSAAASPATRRRLRWPLPLAAAAALAALLAGGWWLTGRQAAGPEPLRGDADSLLVLPRADSAGVVVSFGRVAGADRYHVRLFTEAGTLVAERESGDTTLILPLPPGPDQRLLVQVTALDALSETLASSHLIPVSPSSPPR